MLHQISRNKTGRFHHFFFLCCSRFAVVDCIHLYTVLTRIHRVIIERIPIVLFLPYRFPLYIILLLHFLLSLSFFLCLTLTVTDRYLCDHMRALCMSVCIFYDCFFVSTVTIMNLSYSYWRVPMVTQCNTQYCYYHSFAPLVRWIEII